VTRNWTGPWWGTPSNVASDVDAGFRSLVAGRRVAVVGPALTLAGAASGREIDGFDLVVRFNETFEHLPFDERTARDVGERCDIVYANQTILLTRIAGRSRTARQGMLATARACGLKYLVCTNNSLSYNADGTPRHSCPAPQRGLARKVGRAIADGDTPTQLRMVFDAAQRASEHLDGHYGRTGFIAILDLLGCAPAELFVTGMSFFHGGGHQLAPNAPPLRPRDNRDGSASADASGRGHDSTRELAVMRRLIEGSPSVLRVDAPLAVLLHYGPDLAQRSTQRRTLRTERSHPRR
jgi:hypothetical protein